MKQFSKNTFKNAQVVFQVKEELKVSLGDTDFDEIDIYQLADELVGVLSPKPEQDFHTDPGMRRDYRNYDVDVAFDRCQNAIWHSESNLFEGDGDDSGISQAMFLKSIDDLGAAYYV